MLTKNDRGVRGINAGACSVPEQSMAPPSVRLGLEVPVRQQRAVHHEAPGLGLIERVAIRAEWRLANEDRRLLLQKEYS